MPLPALATRILRLATFATLAAPTAWLAACGTDGGTSAFLPPGPPTSAPPGNLVLYAAQSQGNRIDAFRLGTDGLLPERPFDTIFVENPRRLAIANDVLYATLADNVVAIRLGEDGSLAAEPASATLPTGNYDPVQIEVRNGIVYVAAMGFERVQSFELDDDGDLPAIPTGSGSGQIPADFVSLAFNDGFLYSGARASTVIEVFILLPDGNVPLVAEPQEPQDNLSLPDDMIIRNDILYVTSGSDKAIRAYRLQGGGFLPAEHTSRTNTEEFYSDILIEGDRLYAAAYNAGQIDLYRIEPDGMLGGEPPIRSTQNDPQTYPSKMVLNDGVLYVAQAGIDRIDAYVLDGSGEPTKYPTSSTRQQLDPSYPLDIVIHSLD